MAKIILIDDEAAVLQMMTNLCDRLGHETKSHQTGTEGMASVHRDPPDILIVDLKIGDRDGLDIIRECHQQYPQMAIVLVTGYGGVRTAVDAMRFGAFDYLSKPFDVMDLQKIIARALSAERNIHTAPLAASHSAAPVENDERPIVGESEPIARVLALVGRVADSDCPVLVEGEFGTGKETVARAIHMRSRRHSADFKILHCSALPEEHLESELFGGGSHTGETIFNRAHGGTVLLEEINLLPPRLQSQLDAFLENATRRRAAGSLPASLDIRLIATSTKPLEQEVTAGRFRDDLFYSISVVPLTMPPLRSRADDIPLLTEHFLRFLADVTNAEKPKHLDKYALRMLCNYAWPGNVSELRNALERAWTFADGDRIRPADLPPKVTQKIVISDEENSRLKHHLPIGSKLAEFVRKQEKMFIRESLRYNEGSREKTASMLGISIATLYRKMGIKLEKESLAPAS